MSLVYNPTFTDNLPSHIAERIALAGLFVVFVTCVAIGGSSRPDVLGVLGIRVAAVVALAALLLFAPVQQLRLVLPFGRFALVIVGLVAVQLIPLPPSLWRILPGHASYAAMAEVAVGPVWRPLSMAPDLTVNALLALLPTIAVTFCAAVQPRAVHGQIMFAIILCALGSALLGLLQLAAGEGTVLRWYPLTNTAAAVGIFANRNHHAVFLAGAMPFVAAWARSRTLSLRRGESSRSIGWVLIVACALLLTITVATGSRFGIVAVTIGAIGAAAIYRTGRASERMSELTFRARLIGAISTLAILATVVLLAALPGSALRRLFSQGVGDESRAAWLAPLQDMMMAFMPFGSGFGSFESVYRGFEPFALLRPAYLNAAHNDLAQIMIEGGIGALALLILYLWWWVRTVLVLWATQSQTPEAFVGRAATLATLILMLGSLVDYPLRTPLLACVFAVASVWMAHGRNDIQTLPRTNQPLVTE